MEDSPPKGGWKLGRDSYSKMIVWFKDGNIRTMFSIDWRHRYSKRRDKQIGLDRYKKKIAEYGALAGTIEVYDKASGKLIHKYYEGVEVSTDDEDG